MSAIRKETKTQSRRFGCTGTAHTLPVAFASQSGRGLIELLVSIAVGLVVLSTVLAIYLSTSQTTTQSTQEAEMNEDGALALNILQQQLKLVGYSNYVTAVAAAPTGTPGSGGATPAPTPTPQSGRNFQGAHIFGCTKYFGNGEAAFNDLTCSATAPASSTTPPPPPPPASSAFAIRYEADTVNTYPAGPANAGVPTNCEFKKITSKSTSDADGTTQYHLADNRYFIDIDIANGNRPALFCQGMNSSKISKTALVANVEQMVVKYAVRQPLPAGSPTGTPLPEQIAGYVAADHSVLGATKDNWKNQVIGVNICLLMVSQDPVSRTEIKSGVTDSYVDCHGERKETKTPKAAKKDDKKDGKIRRAYTTTVMFRNVLGMSAPIATPAPTSTP